MIDAWHQVFSALIQRLNRLFNKVFQSAYNPFHISGTLVIALLLVLIVTGVYLLFFFSVSDPYGSLVSIQQQAWLGRWVRALHRYATDAAILLSLYHFLQIFAQGKTWGARTLAWVSGCFLMIALLVSTWTGYVMIWDRHGQMLAEAGLEVIKPLTFIGPAVSTVFSGEKKLTGSFIFMNLFLHVAVPLAMFVMIWIHTSRLRDGKWLPKRTVFVPFFIALLVLSVLRPAPMTGPANLLRITGEVATDWFSYAWVAPFQWLNPNVSLVLAAGGLLFLLVLPAWYKPGKKEREPSFVNVDACTGCKQCSKDCPYEAIEMRPRPEDGKKLHSFVKPELCVSCGVCAGSCSQYAIGPPGRKGSDLKRGIERALASLDRPEDVTLIYYCRGNLAAKKMLRDLSQNHPEIVAYPVECAGNLHATVVGEAGKEVKRSAVWACDFEACLSRLGSESAWERLTQGRPPVPPKKTTGAGVAWFQGEAKSSLVDWLQFSKKAPPGALSARPAACGINRIPVRSPLIAWPVRMTALAGLMALLFLLSTARVGAPPGQGAFRVLLKIPSEVVETRVPWSEAELKGKPRHMRPPEKIERKFTSYKTMVRVDGKAVLEKELSAGRLKKEGLLRLEEDFLLDPGKHAVWVALRPLDGDGEDRVLLDRELEIRRGEIFLFTYDPRK